MAVREKKENLLLSLVSLRREMLQNLSRLIPCSVIEGDGCSARRGVQGLLRTSVQDVNICSKRQIIWPSYNNTLNAYFKMWRSILMLVCVVFKEIIMKILRSSDIHFFFPHHSLTLLVHKNRCCPERRNCVDQEKAVMSAGGRATRAF